MIILGIETSCDETSAAILEDHIVLSNVVRTQTVHTAFGGVVPSLASKDHERSIKDIVQKSINDAKILISDIDIIAVTYGSGLLGSLIVGLNFAKGLSIALGIPLVGVSHLKGHLSSSFINKNSFKYPNISLIVSGGHTQLWLVKNNMDFDVIGNTVDDAAGEAFDKGARILGLKYPGGPEIEKISKDGNPKKYSFTIPEVKTNRLNFSFSGLKTSLLYKKNDLDILGDYSIKDLAASYQHAIVETLISKLERAIVKYKIYNISIVGGVSANMYFRDYSTKIVEKYDLNLIFPEMDYCTDNAAMIAMAGFLKYTNNKNINDITIEPNPNIIYK